jgi:hypothetical protein
MRVFRKFGCSIECNQFSTKQHEFFFQFMSNFFKIQSLLYFPKTV